MISKAVTTKISKSTFSHPCSKFLAAAKVGLVHYDSFRGGGSHISAYVLSLICNLVMIVVLIMIMIKSSVLDQKGISQLYL